MSSKVPWPGLQQLVTSYFTLSLNLAIFAVQRKWWLQSDVFLSCAFDQWQTGLGAEPHSFHGDEALTLPLYLSHWTTFCPTSLG